MAYLIYTVSENTLYLMSATNLESLFVFCLLQKVLYVFKSVLEIRILRESACLVQLGPAVILVLV